MLINWKTAPEKQGFYRARISSGANEVTYGIEEKSALTSNETNSLSSEMNTPPIISLI